MSRDPEIEAFNKERDEVLMSGDLDRFIAFASPRVKFRSREQAEQVFHKMRTAINSLPMEVRRASKQWLIEHGFHALDDGDV